MSASSHPFFAIKRISFARKGIDDPGHVYRNYENGRGVCGIVLNVSGKSEYVFSDLTKKILLPGEIAFFSDKCAYVLTNCSETEDFVHYTVNFELAQGFSLPFDKAYLQLSDTREIRQKIDSLIKYYNSGSFEGQFKSMSVLYNIISEVIGNKNILMIDRKNYKNLLPVLSFIESNYSTDINLSLLAKYCNMSETNFRRVFQQVMGISPIEYVINIRIDHAKELVRHTDLSVAEISSLCGFKDVEHFCRTFKKRTGISTSNYRKGITLE